MKREAVRLMSYLWLSCSLRLVARQSDTINQEHGVNVDMVVVRMMRLISMVGKEIVVVRDKQEEIVGLTRIKRANNTHRLPLLRQIVAVVGRTVVQPEAHELRVVVEVYEGHELT